MAANAAPIVFEFDTLLISSNKTVPATEHAAKFLPVASP